MLDNRSSVYLIYTLQHFGIVGSSQYNIPVIIVIAANFWRTTISRKAPRQIQVKIECSGAVHQIFID
jgi:hypothetical protein